MRTLIATAACAAAGLLFMGCQATFTPPSLTVTTPSVDVQADAPVVEGGVAVDVVPPPAERVYVYDPGFPPGVYMVGGYYYYHGYRYSHDIFVNRYVHENIEHHRYEDVAANRREGARLESRARTEYSRTGGHVQHAGRAREDHTGRAREDHTGRPAETHTGRPAETHTGRPTETHTGRPTETHTGRPAEEHTGRPTETHTGRPAEDHTGRPTETRTGRTPTDTNGKTEEPNKDNH